MASIAVGTAAATDMTSAGEVRPTSVTGVSAPLAPPSLTGAQIRALRPTEPSPVTQFQLRIERWPNNGDSPQVNRKTVALGEDYVAVDEADALHIYDFVLDRLFVVPYAENYIQSWSTYGLTAARLMEARNRVVLRGMLRSTGGSTTASALDQFAFESELGVTAESLQRVELLRSRKGGATTFSYRGEVVAELEFLPFGPSDAARATLLRYLRHTVPLHPQIFSFIAEEPDTPAQFSLFHKSPESSRLVIAFLNWKSVENDYPLASDLQPAKSTDYENKDVRRYVAAALPVVMGKQGTAPSLERALNEAREANGIGDRIGAYVTIQNALQNSLRRGQCVASEVTTCESVRLFFQELLEYPEVSRLYYALTVDQTDGIAVAKAVETLASVDFDRHHNGTLMNIWLANNIVVARRHKTFEPSLLNEKSDNAEDLFLRGIEHDPFVPNYHKDLGDLFFNNYETRYAWVIYDLARSIPGRNRGDLLEEIDRFEIAMRDKHPWYFLP